MKVKHLIEAEAIVFSAELITAINLTWQAIGMDLPSDISNEEAIETVLDADHMKMYGGKYGKKGAYEELDELEKKHGFDAIDKALAKKIHLA